MRQVIHYRKDVAGAREEIFNLIRSSTSNNINIYFDGWQGFGAAAVLRSIAQALASMKAPPPKLCFGRTICIDCSTCTSKREMQKQIAHELRLDHETTAIFDEQDEKDDFSGLDLGSRDAIRSVAAAIDRKLRESRFMMIFINGSEEEVGLGRLGIPENSDYVIVWTFSTCLVTMRLYHHEIAEKLKYTDVLLYCPSHASILSSSEIIAVFHDEASNIVARYPCSMWSMDLETVVDCCLYGLLLMYHSFRSTTGFAWTAHAPNYWICDGIIQGDRAQEISNALDPEISFELSAHMLDLVVRTLNRDPKTPFLVVNRGDDVLKKGPYRWLSVTLMNDKKVREDVQTILAEASSIFLAFQTEDSPRPHGLPNGFFEQCSNLRVLVISCAFSFLSPPFLHCHALRFLGLNHCTDDNTIEPQGEGSIAKWTFLKSLWVIDLYYTNWVEILSEDKIELMTNLMELNIEGVRWPQWTSHHQLQKRLPNLQRLRIIKPMYDEAAETSSDIGDSFLMDNTSLEILDMSGSSRITGRNLTASISKASHLQVLILDGCDEFGDVVLSDNSSLRSFSFDGYGPVLSSHRTSTVELPPEFSRSKNPPSAVDNKKGVPTKTSTSTVSLEGCTRLEKLFLRGLPNLVELNLSGCTIKILDFGAMVVDVPRLQRLFLLGCEHLRAIKWGSYVQRPKLLELICIDTRPSRSERAELGRARLPSLGAQQKSSRLQVHAIITDARLARSLFAPTILADRCYNIRITSSDSCTTRAVVQPEAMSRGTLYDDVFTKVGDGLARMQAFPQAPTGQSNCHIEIGDGSRNVQSEIEEGPYTENLAKLMGLYIKSIHVHDVSTCSSTIPRNDMVSLRWCHIERCPKLHAVFPPDSGDRRGTLETICASDLLMARCVWSKGSVGGYDHHLKSLRHLHLRRCPSLRFALAMGSRPSLPRLETLHIIYCGDLRHVFVPGNEEHQHTSIEFPKLTTIHLHDLPALQQICVAAEMVVPALKTIVIRGCWSLRRLPALKGREPDMRKPMVEVEKDVWDALEWDGVGAGHHPSLYEAPVHSRYYKRRFIRRTVLR